MKKLFLFSFISFAVNFAGAKDLRCQILENNEVTFTNKVYPVLNQKVPIGRTAQTTAYVTEKENQTYIVEAFLTDYDARIYGQGVLNNATDELTASLWGRDSMVDVTCRWAQ